MDSLIMGNYLRILPQASRRVEPHRIAHRRSVPLSKGAECVALSATAHKDSPLVGQTDLFSRSATFTKQHAPGLEPATQIGR